MSVYIVITGNPIDGLRHTGPFDSAEEAIEWGEQEAKPGEWWLVELENPNV